MTNSNGASYYVDILLIMGQRNGEPIYQRVAMPYDQDELSEEMLGVIYGGWPAGVVVADWTIRRVH